MMATTKPSLNQKPASSEGPRPLTKQEIESFRQDVKEGHLWYQQAFKKLNLKPL